MEVHTGKQIDLDLRTAPPDKSISSRVTMYQLSLRYTADLHNSDGIVVNLEPELSNRHLLDT